jgi:crossover junction endodeoxyribonuclease RuvC
MAVYIGVDPGKLGAIAALDSDDMSVIIYDMPATIEGKRAILSEIGKAKIAWVEKPFFPRMIGIKNAVTIAQAFGELKACLFFAGLPTSEVPPSAWKKHFGLSNDKDASRAYAASVFPDQSHMFARKKDDGRAEAALIAYYGWRKK